jgi:chromosome segregation ATPase
MRTAVIVLAAMCVVGAAVASGQSQRAGATLDDVVNEIRGLRADMRQTTRATTQMQLLTARLQLQEQRIAVLSNQRNELNARLAVETRLRADFERQSQAFDENINRNQDLGVPRKELEAQGAFFKSQFEQHRAAELQLQTQDSQLAAEIANEQNRWQDFNSRLDELERSLK